MDKFSQYTENAYGSVLRNSGPPLRDSALSKNFERLGSTEAHVSEIHELGAVDTYNKEMDTDKISMQNE